MDVEEMELKVIETALDSLLDAVYFISVYDGGAYPVKKSRDKQQILDGLGSVEVESLIVYEAVGVGYKTVGSINLVHGNDGWDVIADNSSNLEPILSNATQISEELQDQYGGT